MLTGSEIATAVASLIGIAGRLIGWKKLSKADRQTLVKELTTVIAKLALDAVDND